MGNYWVSWYGTGIAFTLITPWWISGYTVREDGDSPIICAAIRAKSSDEAEHIVRSAHDQYPDDLVFRFVEPRDDDWTPFNGRFPRAEWMRWPLSDLSLVKKAEKD